MDTTRITKYVGQNTDDILKLRNRLNTTPFTPIPYPKGTIIDWSGTRDGLFPDGYILQTDPTLSYDLNNMVYRFSGISRDLRVIKSADSGFIYLTKLPVLPDNAKSLLIEVGLAMSPLNTLFDSGRFKVPRILKFVLMYGLSPDALKNTFQSAYVDVIRHSIEATNLTVSGKKYDNFNAAEWKSYSTINEAFTDDKVNDLGAMSLSTFNIVSLTLSGSSIETKINGKVVANSNRDTIAGELATLSKERYFFIGLAQANADITKFGISSIKIKITK